MHNILIYVYLWSEELLIYLEPGALTGTGLFLDRHDLKNLILQLWSQEEVDDLKLLLKK